MRFVPFEYRGILLDKREFVYGAAIYVSDSEIRIATSILEEQKENNNPYLLDKVIAPMMAPDSLSVSTGRTDENGRDIYTGDIVEYYWFGDIRKGTVVFKDDAFGIEENIHAGLQDIKAVIGNIWGIEVNP